MKTPKLTLQILLLLTFLSLQLALAETKNSNSKVAPLWSSDELARHLTLNQISEAINGIRSAIDGKSWCNLKFEAAKNMILPLRPIYEQKIRTEKTRLENLPKTPKNINKLAKKCKKDCSCNMLSDLYPEQEIFKKLALELNSKDLDRCAAKQQNLCKGPFIPSLRAIVKKEFDAPSKY